MDCHAVGFGNAAALDVSSVGVEEAVVVEFAEEVFVELAEALD